MPQVWWETQTSEGRKVKTIYAEDVDYWKTGQRRSVSQWLDLAESQLVKHGAKDIMRATGTDAGHVTYLFAFVLNDQRFKMVWPVLPCRKKSDPNTESAKVQAATSLYHEIKNCVVIGNRYGKRTGFFSYQMLPDGRTVRELAAPELSGNIAGLLT